MIMSWERCFTHLEFNPQNQDCGQDFINHEALHVTLNMHRGTSDVVSELLG